MKELSIEEKPKDMTHLIDKAALVAEIEKQENEMNYEPFTDEVLGKRTLCKHIKTFLNTLEVKEEVYVVTRSEEHSDYVEAVFLSENEAKEYCKPYNENADCYARNITKIKIQ